jgi:putative transcriptional regulator
MEKIYKDEMAMVCHQAMQAAFDIGAISEEEMRKFDKSCLATIPKQQPERIVRIAKVPGQARA